MRIDESIVEDVAVVSIKGDLLDESAHELLQGKVTDLQVDGIRKVVVDLGHVTKVNSRGISTLISAFNLMRKVGGDIRFAELNKHVTNLFVITRLIQSIPTYETVDRALASYRA